MVRRVVVDVAVTLDGFIEGKNGEIDWCTMEPDMNFPQFLSTVDTIFYGRKSYEQWGQFVPDAQAAEDEQQLWHLVHSKEKHVFSTTQQFDGVISVSGDIAEHVRALKEQPGGDIWLYGGASLVESFLAQQLIDEFRLSVHPIVLGDGKPLFSTAAKRMSLQLVSSQAFASGVVQLIYRK